MAPLISISIPREMWEAVVEHLRRALPYEGCGLLAASGPRETARVVHFFPGTNELSSPTRFRMADREVVHAHRTMRERDWWLAAIVHSHPRGPVTPSPTDLREAFYPEAALLIVDFSGETPVAGAWSVHFGSTRTVADVAVHVD